MKHLAAFIIGIGLFAQSAHAIDSYWVVIKSSSFLLEIQQWGAKLHDNRAACEKTLVKKAMDADYLVQRRSVGTWGYMDMPIGNTDVPYEFLNCVEIEIDLEGSKNGLYD